MEELIFEGKIGDENENIEKSSKEETSTEKSKRLILESSGKFVLLRKMLESFRENGRKVLVFSFFKMALDLIEDFIQMYKFPWTAERVDGDTPGMSALS